MLSSLELLRYTHLEVPGHLLPGFTFMDSSAPVGLGWYIPVAAGLSDMGTCSREEELVEDGRPWAAQGGETPSLF